MEVVSYLEAMVANPNQDAMQEQLLSSCKNLIVIHLLTYTICGSPAYQESEGA